MRHNQTAQHFCVRPDLNQDESDMALSSKLFVLQVDIVYLAMLHTGHCAAALLMIAAGKHVLVEKPFAMNEREARKMIKVAKKKVRPLLSRRDTHLCGHRPSVAGTRDAG